MPGRPRKPTALHIVQGTMDTEQRKRAGQAPGAVFVPLNTPPDHLDAEEKKNWKEFAANLSGMRVTTRDDMKALELLAVSWTQWRRLTQKLRDIAKKEPEWITTYKCFTDQGYIIRPRPEVVQIRTLENSIRQLLGAFGMTPADRTKVRDLGLGAPSEGGDPDAEFT